jgi:hypothetical protein
MIISYTLTIVTVWDQTADLQELAMTTWAP